MLRKDFGRCRCAVLHGDCKGKNSRLSCFYFTILWLRVTHICACGGEGEYPGLTSCGKEVPLLHISGMPTNIIVTFVS